MKVFDTFKHAVLAAVCFTAAAWFHQNTSDGVLIYTPFILGLLAIAAGI